MGLAAEAKARGNDDVMLAGEYDGGNREPLRAAATQQTGNIAYHVLPVQFLAGPRMLRLAA